MNGRHCSITATCQNEGPSFGQIPLTSSPVPLIFNPTAGRGHAGRHAAAVSASLSANGVSNTPVATSGVGDLERIVTEKAAEGHRQVIVVGGDGSIHEAVNGILPAHSDVEIGIIPMGTGNDFAKASSIPLHWPHATSLLADRMSSGAPARPVDAGRCNGRYFANGAGIGFDAKVSAIARDIRLPIGDLVYLIAVFRAMRDGIVTPKLTMTFGDEIVEGPLTLANFSNGPWIGGMFNIAPQAYNDDGQLDLVYADAVTRRRVLALLPKILRGRHLSEPDVHTSPLKKCEVVADAPVISHLDGEIQPLQTRFSIEISAGALQLL